MIKKMEDKMSILNGKVEYDNLNNKQKEIYNFQSVSAVFAVYGYSVTPLRDDVEFADFVAVSFSEDKKRLFIQLKGGLTFWNKYLNKDLYICFFDRESKTWYLYPHDELYTELESELHERVTDWDKKLEYNHAPSFPAWAKTFLDKYKIDQ
jgi:hypothetical protein